ncbi:MAG: hypothetical protein IJ157_04250, partial [Clostridia bacterium]|nr:hypothetical protein [Clostridia bacterium]
MRKPMLALGGFLLTAPVFLLAGAALTPDRMAIWLLLPALAALLLPALAQKDRAALAIAEKAAGDLSELVLALFRKAGLETGELALNGSILLHCPQIRDRVETLVREKLPKV